jgi:chloramphenicol-sensitive protein RarD
MKNKKITGSTSKEFYKGILYTFSAFFLWGILPMYWKLLSGHATSFEILLHRIIWLFGFFIILNLITKRKQVYTLLKNKKTRYLLILSSLMIGINWFFYIYAVNTNRIVESSLGYYINPLISILFGLIFLKEKLNKLQWIAVILAFTGVLILTIRYGKLPWISLILACSFALYGLLKKIIKGDSLSCVTIETLYLFPFALILLILKYVNNIYIFTNRSLQIHLLLILGGIITGIPLLLFTLGTQRIPLSNVGFIQYTTPTIMLLLGIFLYKENFSLTHLISFSFIWSALLIYSITILIKKAKKNNI